MIEESPGEQQDQIMEEQMKENHSHQELLKEIFAIMEESPGQQQNKILSRNQSRHSTLEMQRLKTRGDHQAPGIRSQQNRILEEKVEEKHSHQKVAAMIEESMSDGPMNQESPGEQQDQILEEKVEENNSHQKLRP